MQKGKRILSVKLLHEIDTDPDTSYLGEYANNPTSDYSIDRKHSLDCQVNTHANDEVINRLERVLEYLNRCKHENAVMFRNYEFWNDAHTEAQTILFEKQDELAECDCDESGDLERNQYRYFSPSDNYDGEPAEEIRKYVRQDYERMSAYNNDQWYYIGVSAEAEVQLSSSIVQRISSGGLWGIESDSDASYIAEIEQEQLADLKAELRAIGFGTRAISKAFQNVERGE